MKFLKKGFRMKVINAVRARPKFMKIASVYHEIKRYNATNQSNPINAVIVHTGQHYDYGMSKVFFKDLDLPEPNIYLGVGSGTHCIYY